MEHKHHTTKEDERGELPRCLACDRPAPADAIIEGNAAGEPPLVFCDARCREDYFARIDALSEGEDRDAA